MSSTGSQGRSSILITLTRFSSLRMVDKSARWQTEYSSACGHVTTSDYCVIKYYCQETYSLTISECGVNTQGVELALTELTLSIHSQGVDIELSLVTYKNRARQIYGRRMNDGCSKDGIIGTKNSCALRGGSLKSQNEAKRRCSIMTPKQLLRLAKLIWINVH